jgi:hypothetical protein
MSPSVKVIVVLVKVLAFANITMSCKATKILLTYSNR